MWIVRTVDQKRAAKSAAIKSYKWMSYIPSQNLQIAANLASLDVGDQMFETNFPDSCHNLQMLTIHWPRYGCSRKPKKLKWNIKKKYFKREKLEATKVCGCKSKAMTSVAINSCVTISLTCPISFNRCNLQLDCGSV